VFHLAGNDKSAAERRAMASTASHPFKILTEKRLDSTVLPLTTVLKPNTRSTALKSPIHMHDMWLDLLGVKSENHNK